MLASAGHDVIGVDIKQDVLSAVGNGNSHIDEPGLDELLKETVNSGKLRTSSAPVQSDAFIIAVPTPLNGKSAIRIPDPMLSDSARSEIQNLMAQYPRARSAILPALYVAQQEIGWLPDEAMDEIALLFGMEPAEVYAIAGFYNMFYKEPKGKFHLEICTNVPCMLRGSGKIADYLQERLGIGFGETTADGNFSLDHMECLGSCATGPVVFARRSQSAWGRYFENLTPGQVDVMLDELLLEDALPGEQTPARPYHHDHHPETNYLLARIDKPHSHKIETYLADGGYETARKALAMEPAEVIETVKKAGVRGRGGAGFPAGVKWGFIPKDIYPRYLVVNADESEPGTFKDRLILEFDPHQLLEGIICTSWAIQAHYAFVYVRGEYMFAQERMKTAIAEAKAKGFLGKGIFGSDFDLEVIIHSGAGAYICGEETALLSSLEGYRGQEPADVGYLQQMLLKLSDFVDATPEIQEIDMNPVFSYRDGAVVVDARIILSEE